MEIKIVENKEEWNQFLQTNAKEAPFTQSYEWGEILLKEGKKVERLAVYDDNKIIGQAQIVWANLLFGLNYTFCPKGPVITSGNEVRVLAFLSRYLQKQRSVFLRLEPAMVWPRISLKKTIDINPSTTTIIAVAGQEDAWLARMKKNTRYSIRQALKNNLIIKTEKNLEVFWKLLSATAVRDGFKTHPKKHYEVILSSGSVYQLSAYHQNVPVATAVFVAFGNTLTYLFAASDYDWHKLSASYLLQLEALRLAEKLGCKYYDMFGIAPPLSNKGGEYEYDPAHQYAKITLFKLGFGGEIRSSPGTYDIILKKWHFYFYKLLRSARRLF